MINLFNSKRINTGFEITKIKNNKLRISSTNIYLEPEQLAPVILGEKPIKLEFNNEVTTSGAIGKITGTITSATHSENDIDVTREYFLSDDNNTFAIRMYVKNNRDKAIQLKEIDVFNIKKLSKLKISGASFSDWRIVRMGRHKADIPSNFKFDTKDQNYIDATFDSSRFQISKFEISKFEISKFVPNLGCGVGDIFQKNFVVSEPALYIKNSKKENLPGLFVGVIGQANHLTGIMIKSKNSNSELIEFSCLCEFDSVQMNPGNVRETHWFIINEILDEKEVFPDFANIVADNLKYAGPQKKPLSIYSPWQFYGLEFCEKDLNENLAALKRNNLPFDVIQIDNGWFNAVGDWDPSHHFPMGMTPIAKKIVESGYVPGIWTCPSVLMHDSKMFLEHPELVAKRRDGSYAKYEYIDGSNTKAYSIDPTSPYFREYILNLYKKLRDQGYSYHKIDFLRSLIIDEDIVFYDKTVNRAGAYKIMNETLREAIGDGYITSCGGVHDAGNISYIDALRTSSDTYGFWIQIGLPPRNALIRLKENLFRAYTNRFWRVDSDAACIRRRKIIFRQQLFERHNVLNYGLYTNEEVFTVLASKYISGGNISLCERIEELDDDRRELYSLIIPSLAIEGKILESGWKDCPNYFLTEVKPRCNTLENWWTLSISNWEDDPKTLEVDLQKLGLPQEIKELAVFEIYQQFYEGIKKIEEIFSICIPPHGTRVFRLAKWDGKTPILLGTDLHITGGGVEIASISISDDKVTGTIKTDWKQPVKILALFPFEDQQKLKFDYIYGDKKDFNISKQ